MYPTAWKIIPWDILQQGKIIPSGEGYNAKKSSAMYPTVWKIIPWCVPQQGKLFPVVWDITQNNLPHCIPQHGRLFHGVSHNKENYSAVYPTMGDNLFIFYISKGSQKKSKYTQHISKFGTA